MLLLHLFQISVYDVNDNCPILANDSFSFEPVPALEVAPILYLSASDADSGEYGEVQFVAATSDI